MLPARIAQTVIHGVYPFHVRPEANGALQVERQVNAETSRLRNGIDQVPEGRLALHPIVHASRISRFRRPPTGLTLDPSAELRSPEPCRIDESSAAKRIALADFIDGSHDIASVAGPHGQHFGAKGN